MRAGTLNCRVTFQKATNNSPGHSAKTWSDDFKKWAKIESSLSSDIEKSGKQIVEVTHVINCRYSEKITTDHRVSYKGQFYEIIGNPINLGNKNTTTQLKCKEINNA